MSFTPIGRSTSCVWRISASPMLWTYDSIPDIRTLFTLSNFNGNVSITFTNLGTNDPGIVCMNKNFMSMDTNGIAVTNFFSTNWLTTNFPPTAVPGVDYYPPQQATVIFDDFQMSADIFVN